MTTLTQQTPTVGQSDSTEDVKLVNNVTTLTTWANGSIDGVNVVASLTGRRLIARQAVAIAGGSPSGNSVFTTTTILPSGTLSSSNAWVWNYLDPTNYAVVGKSNTQLVVRLAIATNGTAPAITFAGSLNAATFSSGTGTIAVNAGAVQGTSASVASPGANSVSIAETAPFAFPAAGAYVPTLNLSGGTPVNSLELVTWELFVLNS